jgi:hypothetical protein
MSARSLAKLMETVRNESSDGALLLENPSDNPVCSLCYDENLSCIKVVWRKYATSAQLRFLHEYMLDMMERYGAQRILGDDRELPIIHAEDQRWIVEDWLPRARTAGLKAVAAITSLSFFGRLSIGSIHLSVANTVSIKQFQTIREAVAWLNCVTRPQQG